MSAVTAVVSVLTTVVAGLVVARYDSHETSRVAQDVFGRLPATVSVTDVVLGLLAVVVVIFGVSVGAALTVAGRMLRPVRELAVAADRVAAGDLSVRLRPVGQDELAGLAYTFNAMTARVEETVAELRRLESNARGFVSDVSHELRTPLAAMTAVTEVLQARAASMDPDAERATHLVVASIARLDRLVADLMEMSRFDAGTVTLDLDVVLVSDAVAACLDLRGWAGLVAVDVPADLSAAVDRRRLDVILANLVGNALKYGEPPVRLRAEGRDDPDGPQLVVTVADTGPGLAGDVLPRVFDRFYKAEAARTRSDGSGLGLAIALENARLHGGTITAANAPEGGAVFTLTIPRRVASTG